MQKSPPPTLRVTLPRLSQLQQLAQEGSPAPGLLLEPSIPGMKEEEPEANPGSAQAGCSSSRPFILQASSKSA